MSPLRLPDPDGHFEAVEEAVLDIEQRNKTTNASERAARHASPHDLSPTSLHYPPDQNAEDPRTTRLPSQICLHPPWMLDLSTGQLHSGTIRASRWYGLRSIKALDPLRPTRRRAGNETRHTTQSTATQTMLEMGAASIIRRYAPHGEPLPSVTHSVRKHDRPCHPRTREQMNRNSTDRFNGQGMITPDRGPVTPTSFESCG